MGYLCGLRGFDVNNGGGVPGERPTCGQGDSAKERYYLTLPGVGKGAGAFEWQVTPARREKLQQFARREQVSAPNAHRLFLSVLRLPRSGRRRRPQATRMLATPSFENDPSACVKAI